MTFSASADNQDNNQDAVFRRVSRTSSHPRKRRSSESKFLLLTTLDMIDHLIPLAFVILLVRRLFSTFVFGKGRLRLFFPDLLWYCTEYCTYSRVAGRGTYAF